MFYRFANPEFLLVLLAVPVLCFWYARRNRKLTAPLRFSSLTNLKLASKPGAARARHLIFAMRMLAFALLVAAFARPQSGVSGEEVLTQGIDIVLALDVSSSMLAQDIEPNRLEATKQVAANFIQGRRNDRIGMVVFAADGYTQCPLTLDYNILLDFLKEIRVGMIDDGTAMGMGIATAVNRLKNSDAKSKVLILLTDGRNNAGEIDPLTAADLAKTFQVRIYAIGAGARGLAPYPVDDPVIGRRTAQIRVDIDEDTLRKVAELTGGKYFRATNRESLEEVYREIDSLEKTEIKVKEYTRYGELFSYPLSGAIFLLLVEVALANTWFRRIP